MLVIGLTGGIGAGKTTVSNLFMQQHVPIIDADMIAREVTQTNSPALQIIANHFGIGILHSDGSLNRTRLRQIVFEQPQERIWLEQVLHPLIRAEIEKRIQTITAPYCIVVIPLLFQVAPYPFIDRVLVVDAAEDIQVKRVMQRDRTDETHINAILKSQTQREERRSKADDIILNEGSLLDLEKQVQKLHSKYLQLSEAK